MSIIWYKIILLQLLIAVMSHQTELELDKKTKLSSERLLISLLKKMLEDDINDLHLTKDPIARSRQIEDVYDESYYITSGEKTNLDRSDNSPPSFDDYKIDVRMNRNKFKKGLCQFKICSVSNYKMTNKSDLIKNQ